MRCWAYNFINIEVRAMKCLPLKVSINKDFFDQVNSQKNECDFKPIKTFGFLKTQNFGTIEHFGTTFHPLSFKKKIKKKI